MTITRVYHTHDRRRLSLRDTIGVTRAIHYPPRTRTVARMLRARRRSYIISEGLAAAACVAIMAGVAIVAVA